MPVYLMPAPWSIRNEERANTLLSVTIQTNHRWTQMNTDKDDSRSGLIIAVLRSLDGDPKPRLAEPESCPQNLCESVSICGSLLHDRLALQLHGEYRGNTGGLQGDIGAIGREFRPQSPPSGRKAWALSGVVECWSIGIPVLQLSDTQSPRACSIDRHRPLCLSSPGEPRAMSEPEIWDVHCHLSGRAEATPEKRMEALLKYADRLGITRLCLK